MTYGNDGKMALIISHFEDVLDFAKFDVERSSDDDAKMEAFIALCDGIERNAIGNTMKQQMIETGVVKKCLDYLTVRYFLNGIGQFRK
jgi:E3 ubiquitin-protein ligase UBR4